MVKRDVLRSVGGVASVRMAQTPAYYAVEQRVTTFVRRGNGVVMRWRVTHARRKAMKVR